MREILFRGKRVDNGEWVEGSYFHDVDKRFGVVTEGDFIIGFTNKTSQEMENIEVDPETVGQYAGLLDKNGKKIFEGDIVEFDGDCKRDIVVWGNGEYNGVSGFRLKIYPLFSVTMSNHNLFEVIGNVFDNSELIGERK